MNPTNQLSTNGALTYALRFNRINLFDLVSLGQHQAIKLKWVGPKVWSDAKHIVSNCTW